MALELAEVARRVEGLARKTGRAVYDLPRGLRVEMVAIAGRRILTVSRPYDRKGPAELEVELVRQAFGVPEDAGREDLSDKVRLRWVS